MRVKNNNLILRQNLIQMFDNLSDKPLIYICAPAGYGKTVAIQQWLNGNTHVKVIISIDEYHNNPTYFCERFCAAMHNCQPQNAVLSEIISHPAFNSAPDEFTIHAISALKGRKRTVFVIDDLHLLYDEMTLRLLLIFLKRLPENFQVVLVSRNDLPPGFSDLWIKEHLACVTAEQLRFNSKDIMLLYKKRGNHITLKQAEDIYHFTGGWAIGINALLLSDGEPSGKNLDVLEEFIQSNIWVKYDETTREFLLNTAAARELTPSLCTALTDVSDSQMVLNELVQSGVFISQTKDNVYHYHHLFHSFLKNILKKRSDEYLYHLLGKEGQWHLSQQDFYNAVDCFIQCGNLDNIAKCFMLFSTTGYYYYIVEKILPITNAPEVRAAADKYPFMLSLMVWAALAEGRAGDMATYMDQYYARNSEIVVMKPANAHYIFYIRMLDYRTPLSNLVSDITKLPYTPESKKSTGPITMNMLLLHRGMRDFSEFVGENTQANIIKVCGIISWLYGEEAKLLTESMVAGLLYEQGHLEKAHIHALVANAEIKNHFAPEIKCCAVAIFIYVLDALGQADEAESTLELLTTMIEQDRAYYLNCNIKAMTVRRKLAKGDVKVAQDWLEEYETKFHASLKFYKIYSTFTTCRAYIVNGDYNKAIILLSKLLELARTFKRPLDFIEAQILLSIAYWKKKRGFEDEAILHLEAAVSTAYGFGYTQLFVNEGLELAGMIRRLQKRTQQRHDKEATPVSFIKMLYLKMTESQNTGLTSGQAVVPTKYTDKQKMVMKLLCEGRSNREIAEIMGIKITTLRSHIELIYKKLDVTSEIDAIKKINTLGLLKEM